MSRDEVEKKIKEYTDIIVSKFDPEKIILFGSYAWGNPGPDSDVDLFVVKETENIRVTAREIDGSIFPRFVPLDLIVYTSAGIRKSLQSGNLFIRDILTNGRVVYEK